MDVRQLLERVKEGSMPLEEAEEYLKKLPYEDIGCAKLDYHRALRAGFGEVIYGPGKTVEQIAEICSHFAERRQNVLATRVSPEQAAAVKRRLPEAEYEKTGRTLQLVFEKKSPSGYVAVCTGGTADIPVAEEAARTAEFFGCRVERFFDVGVAGIHRLFSKLDEIRKANCIVAAAGMEGALPGVISGLVENPVIAVPTSVGYGAGFQGVAPLLTMLNSCAEGISVVNIDNGFGAGYLAAQINRLAERGRKDE